MFIGILPSIEVCEVKNSRNSRSDVVPVKAGVKLLLEVNIFIKCSGILWS